MPGEKIEFQSQGQSFQGYLSPSVTGSGPGVIVLQEWWGLVGHIKSVADRFAAAGFTALAPDFYHGKATTEPDEAGSMMMALNIAEAELILNGAVEALLQRPETIGEKAGVVGFCMGGQLSLFAACINPKIGACVDFYGIHPNVQPPLENLQARFLGFFGEEDHVTPAATVKVLGEELSRLGKDYEIHIFPGVGHAFFNDDRPAVYSAETADFCWQEMTQFFREHL